ncbi:MAG: type II toxin-antitoxin system RelE/ParE family toxin [Cyanobacteria bacterium P01_G01_bin.54]
MAKLIKRPQVIRDLIDLATYIAQGNLDSSDRFLRAADETFKQLGQMSGLGRVCYFESGRLQGMRQLAVKGFRKYLVFYRVVEDCVEIVRVLHGSRDLEAILEEDLG